MRPNSKIAAYRLVCIFSIFFFSLSAFSQKRGISGQISDASGTPISGATVNVKGTNSTVAASTNGQFIIAATTGDTLVISSVGYQAREVPVGDETKLVVQLETLNKTLDDVIIVGYGVQRKSSLTSSVAKLDPRVLESGVRSNPAQALSGTIAGLRVSTTSGKPGALPTIMLRGGTNFDGSGSPLVIVDGQYRPSLSDINPEDIASIEVLKDAAATAIYGARASNGVILVTSKRGKSGATSIHLKTKTGINFLNSPYELLSAEEYLYWGRKALVETFKVNGNQALINAPGPRGTGNLYKNAQGDILDGNYDLNALFSPMRLTDANRELLNSNDGWRVMKDAIPTNAAGAYDPNGTYADLIYKEFSYADQAFHKRTITQDYNVGMTGGNSSGSYYANLGYYDEKGLAQTAFYKRLNFSATADYQIKPWLKSESTVNFSQAKFRDQAQTSDENYWGRLSMSAPTMRGNNYKGEPLLGRSVGDANTIVNKDKYIRRNQDDKFVLSQAFRVEFNKNLFLRLSGIMMYDEGYSESFDRDFRNGVMSLTNPDLGWSRIRASSAAFDRTTRQTYTATLNYSRSFSTHYLNAMLGGEYFNVYNEGVSASGRLAPTDNFSALNLTSAAANDRGMASYHTRDRLLSAFGRVNYDWRQKYLATVTVRSDGSSRLIGDNQYGIFPGASVGWVISREDFMSELAPTLSFLKLRGSWGKNGNIGIGTSNGIGLYELQGGYNTTTRYDNTIGFQLGGVPNPGLRWEKTNTVEAAWEYGLFKNKLMGSFAYYNRITSDKITNVNLPTSSGINAIRTNNGTMRNRGFEAEITYKAVQGKNWNVFIGGNVAWNKNTVLKLPFNGNDKNRQDGTQIYDPRTGQVIWVGGLQEGQEPGEIFGYLMDGIIRTQKDLDEYNKIDLAAGQVQLNSAAGRPVASQQLITQRGLTGFWSTDLGDMRWKDIDGNDTIDTRDRVSLGRVVPRWTGGFNFAIGYKGFQLFTRMDFALGFIQMDLRQMWALGSMQGEYNGTDLVRDTWTPENPNAKFPTYVNQDQQLKKNYDRNSDMFWLKSNYLCFREVTLSYTIPESFLRKFRIAGLTIQATGQNLGYLSNKMLRLPERSGSQGGNYTIPTNIVFAANLRF